MKKALLVLGPLIGIAANMSAYSFFVYDERDGRKKSHVTRKCKIHEK